MLLPENYSTSSPALQPLDDTQRKLGVEKRISTTKNLHFQVPTNKQDLSQLIMALKLLELWLNSCLNSYSRASGHTARVHHSLESLALARKSLNCECNEELAGFIYGKLRTLKKKKKNPNRAIETNITGQPVSVEDTQISWEETSTNLRNDHMFQNKEMDSHGNFTNGALQEVSSGVEHMISGAGTCLKKLTENAICQMMSFLT